MENKKNLIITGAVFILIALAAGGVIYAKNKNSSYTPSYQNFAQKGFSSRFNRANFKIFQGNVSNVNGNTVVVDNNTQGQRVVTLSSTTRVVKSTSDTQNDVVAIGNNVTVMGSKNNSDISAASVILIPNQNPNPSNISRRRGNGNFSLQNSTTNPLTQNSARGKITQVNSNTFTIQSFNKTYTISFDSNTKFEKQQKGNNSDIIENSSIMVLGTADSTGTIQARSVTIF